MSEQEQFDLILTNLAELFEVEIVWKTPNIQISDGTMFKDTGEIVSKIYTISFEGIKKRK